MTVGVPESTQALERLNPVGSAGGELHEVIAPPIDVGVCAVIVVEPLATLVARPWLPPALLTASLENFAK
jgi:hypothetical protein